MAYRRDEMWSEGRYEYERLPRERLPPRIHSDGTPYVFGNIKPQESAKFLHFQQTGNQISLNRDDYHRVVNVAPKKPPLLDRPAEGSYSRYDDYSHVDYRDYEEGRSFAHERRSGPPHRGEDPGYRWPREDYSISRQPEYRELRDGLRRKSFYPSHYLRERSPHKRDSPFFRESPVSRRDSPHSRSGSSVSSRSYSPERSKAYSFHQSQHSRSKERSSAPSLKTSRDTSPSGSTAVPSSKILDKSSRLSEKELAEAASKWAAEKSEKADESNLPEITEYDAGSSAPLYVERTEETETNITDSTELYEDNQLLGRSKAIATKTKEIEQVYRQDCETFGMVVKMLIDKDPSLEKSIQFALRQNLHEIGERCIEELKHFIAEYDAANQELAESFKEGAY
ncbi:periphilin-1 isoform X4 [Gopherus flavomarginatus]|uniref:periphilin-1 isoform X4 n=1 Tax=Gopherus flavomarginatus TaxID=286002 RepID=UPI0021CC0FF8|nr:periphilin-1 isoform X4 [Gopherus flavomarginatus]